MCKEIAKELIKKHEGFRRFPYRDTMGNLTIGYGFNLTEWGTKGISEKEAELILEAKITLIREELKQWIPHIWSKLDEVRKAVLIDMGFNLGVPKLMGFKRMLKALDKGDYQEAAKEMINSRWAEQVKTRAERLANIMQTGKIY